MTISVKDLFGHTALYTLYVYQATITHTPTNGVGGHQISFSGTGWPANDLVSLRLVPGNTSPTSNLVPTLCTVNADTSGTIAPQTCAAPTDYAAGTYSVYAYDTYISKFDATSFDMNPSVSLTSSVNSSTATSRVYIGEAVGVAGTGWAPGTRLSATFAGAAVTLSPVPAVNSNGEFSGTGFTIPNETPGVYTLTVSDNNGLTASYNVNVYKPTISHTPTTVLSGGAANFTGAGWPANDSVKIALGTGSGATFLAAAIPCTFTTTSTGALPTQACTIPTFMAAGTFTVVAEDSSMTVQVATTLTITPALEVLNSTTEQPTASAAPGATVQLYGTGFGATTTIASATLGATTLSLSPVSPVTSASGQLSGATFTVPSTAGTFTLTIKDALNNTATVQFTVT